jgi:hypothetical protein
VKNAFCRSTAESWATPVASYLFIINGLISSKLVSAHSMPCRQFFRPYSCPSGSKPRIRAGSVSWIRESSESILPDVKSAFRPRREDCGANMAKHSILPLDYQYRTIDYSTVFYRPFCSNEIHSNKIIRTISPFNGRAGAETQLRTSLLSRRNEVQQRILEVLCPTCCEIQRGR